MVSDLDYLDQRVRDYYGRQSLSAGALRRLMQTIRTTSPASGEKSAARLKPWVIVAALCSAVAAVGVIVLLLLSVLKSPENDVARITAAEVAANHRKQFAVEYTAPDVARLGAQMLKLDFSLSLPRRFQDGSHQLLGGRYCSIRGQIAAQLRLADAHGHACTLYEVRPVDALASVRDVRFEVDGCQVELWREDGLLMALAREPR
jgi:hypothetical protein